MKKVLVITMVLVMMGTAGCGKSEASDINDRMINEITVEDIELEEIVTETIETENIILYDDVTETWD